MEIVSLRKYCKLCFKIHYVKVFRSFLSSFFWKRRKKANQRKKKKQVRPIPENSLKKHERILGTGDCRECSRKCVFSFKFENNGWNTPEMRSVGEHFCRNVRSALRSILWKRAAPNLPRSFFLLSLVTFLPFSFSKEKVKESNEKLLHNVS